MGIASSRRTRVYEPYTSFDVLPTEYFNRRSIQQQCSIQQSPPIIQSVVQPVCTQVDQCKPINPACFQQPFYQPCNNFQQLPMTQSFQPQQFGYNHSMIGHNQCLPQSRTVIPQIINLPRRQLGAASVRSKANKFKSLTRLNRGPPAFKYWVWVLIFLAVILSFKLIVFYSITSTRITNLDLIFFFIVVTKSLVNKAKK